MRAPARASLEHHGRCLALRSSSSWRPNATPKAVSSPAAPRKQSPRSRESPSVARWPLTADGQPKTAMRQAVDRNGRPVVDEAGKPVMQPVPVSDIDKFLEIIHPLSLASFRLAPPVSDAAGHCGGAAAVLDQR